MGETDTYAAPCQSDCSAQPDYLHKKLVFKYRKSNRPDKNQLGVSDDFLHKTCFHPVCDHMLWVRCISSAKSAWHWHLTADGILHLWDVHQKNWVIFLPILLHVVFVQNTSLPFGWEVGRAGGKHGLAWEEKKYLSKIIRVRVEAWKLHSGQQVVAWIKAKLGIENLALISSTRVILLSRGAGCLQLPVGLWAAQHFSDWCH